MALAVGRFWSTFGIKTHGLVIALDSIGALMSLGAFYYLTRQPPRYMLVFFMTSTGFLLAVGYLVANLLHPANLVVPESVPKSKAEPG